MNEKDLQKLVAESVKRSGETGAAIGAMWKSVLENIRR